jgi:replicative DNA helicase
MSKEQSWNIPDDDVEWEELEKKWADRKEDDFINQVMSGKQGLNFGLSNGLQTINKYIHGTHRGRYILIGADSGVGKTTLSDFMYIFSLWMDCKAKGIKLYVKYFSFEISSTEKKAKWVSQWIKRVYKLEFSVDYIMGRIPGKTLTDEHFKMVLRAYGIIEEMMQDIEIIDHMLHPTGMLNVLIENHYAKIGTIIRDTPKEGKKKGMIRSYKPNNSTDFTLVMVDHLALINLEAGATVTKAIMDRWSMYSVQLRNIFKTTIINIQQFSTSLMSAYREQKKSEASIAPQRLDFGDSTYTFRDADLVLGLVKPYAFSMQTFHGFPLQDIGQYFIVMYLMKNRYGPADRVFPLYINPIAGMFWDMPVNPMAKNTSGDLVIDYFIKESQRLDSLI